MKNNEDVKHASSTKYRRYFERINSSSRKQCYCGCMRKATHSGMSNGITLIIGCELSIRRWVKYCR